MAATLQQIKDELAAMQIALTKLISDVNSFVPTPPLVALTNITISNTTFVGGKIGAIGNITVQASNGAFAGTLALSGTNANNFQIVNTVLMTKGVVPSGTYSINIIATMAGATGSPFTKGFYINGSSVTLVESPQGTTVTPISPLPIIDAKLNKWTLVGGQVALNGKVDTNSSAVTMLLYWYHTLYQTSPNGSSISTPGWWSWNGTSWVDAPNPTVISPTGPSGPTLPPVPSGPTPPGPAFVGPTVATKGFVDIDFANNTGAILHKELFGSSMACDGGFNSLPDNWGNPNAQQAAKVTAGFGLPGMYVRINNEDSSQDGGGNMNTNFVDSVSSCLPKIIDITTGTFSFGIGNRGASPSQNAAGAVAIHNRFKANGVPCYQYELLNENQDVIDMGSYCSIFNAVADALHSIDQNIKLIGTNDSWMNGGRMASLANSSGNRVGRFHYHSYSVGPDKDDPTVMGFAQSRFGGDARGLRSAVQGTPCANTPAGLGEYNMDGNPGEESRQWKIQGAVWNCLGLYSAFSADPLTTHGAIWDWYGDGSYGLVIDPKSNPSGLPAYSVVPVGYALKMCRQSMGGSVATSKIGTGNLRCIATSKGNTFGIMLINFDTSASYNGQITLNHWPVNSTGNATINMQQLNPSNLTPAVSTLTVSGGVTSITLPAMSVTVFSS